MGEHEFNNAEMKFYENATLINSGQWFNSEGRNFRQEFSKRYGYFPGPVAAYAFDGMMLIINAIRNGGTDREQIQNYLRLVTYNGVTGVIRFDERGNRTGKACLMKIKNGIPAATGR
jgi:branched-chain amino acid transport system substrate-binding protein